MLILAIIACAPTGTSSKPSGQSAQPSTTQSKPSQQQQKPANPPAKPTSPTPFKPTTQNPTTPTNPTPKTPTPVTPTNPTTPTTPTTPPANPTPFKPTNPTAPVAPTTPIGPVRPTGLENLPPKAPLTAAQMKDVGWLHANGQPVRTKVANLPTPNIPQTPVKQVVTMEQMRQLGWKKMTEPQLQDLNRALTTYHIDTPQRIQHFLAQASTESLKGTYTKELANGLKYNGRTDLGNVYPGDGPHFKGTGYMQMTGRENYQQLAVKLNDPNVVTGGVNYVAKNYPWTSAGQWWSANNMNSFVDKGATVTDVSRRVNGAITQSTHLPDRIENFNKAEQIFK